MSDKKEIVAKEVVAGKSWDELIVKHEKALFGEAGTSEETSKSVVERLSDLEAADVAAMHYKGSVASKEALPTDAAVGDLYNVSDTGANYAFNGSTWDDVSLMNIATEDAAGLVKLGTGTALTTSTGGVVGATTDGQLLAKAAGDSTLGTVKLNDVVKKELWHGNGTYWYAFNEGSRTLNMKAKPIHGLQKFTWDDGKSLEFPTIAANASETIATATEVNTNATAIETEVARAKAAEALLAPKASPTFTGTVSVGDSSCTLSSTQGVLKITATGGITTTGGITATGGIVASGEVSGATYSFKTSDECSFVVNNATNGDLFKVGGSGVSVLTFVKSDNTTTTLAALEARVAALEAAANTGA